ncbi:unnamed protein product [Schistosoma margrebowiei]|uniref:Uncharacterized protein n=1 Tax=Schistosoma margrebowiei TaxID=48269 RepID=A0A183N5Y8_9TREM|nr:unnamed protein product [Schistosoma margrebowiei]
MGGSMTKILPGLYVGGFDNAKNEEELMANCISHIIIVQNSKNDIERVNSDHALVRARICLRLTGRRKDAARKPLRGLLNDSQAKSIFQEQLGKQLGSHVCDAHFDAAWNDIRKAVEIAVISASKSYRSPIDLPGMVEPTGTYVPANIARLGHHDRQAQPPRQGSSFGRGRM